MEERGEIWYKVEKKKWWEGKKLWKTFINKEEKEGEEEDLDDGD